MSFLTCVSILTNSIPQINLKNPYSLTTFKGLISMSYSCKISNQIEHIPSLSGWINILLMGGCYGNTPLSTIVY